MSDITMCKGEGCPVADTCKRFNATPGMMQSYFTETPGQYSYTVLGEIFVEEKWVCDMYWGERQDAIMDVLQKAVGG